MKADPRGIDLRALRASLARGGGGPAFWKSLDAVAGTPAFQRFLRAEFPAASPLADAPDRRRFLRLMAASFALAGLTGCDGPDPGEGSDLRNREVPYVRNPERVQAGAALSYASATLIDGFANGALVTTRDGRPLKVEGNPQHPWSRGGTDVLGQASILGLYDPFRSQSVRFRDQISGWQPFIAAITGRLAELRAAGGKGLRVLSGPITSPSVRAQIADLRTALPDSHWHTYAPVERDALYAGTQLAFGRRMETRWRFDRAQVVVALDGDFLDPGPHQVGVARGWTDARREAAAKGSLLALHAAAATPNLTSAKADHRVPVAPGLLAGLPERLLASAPGSDPVGQWCARAGAALREARGRGIVLAGAAQPPPVQEAVHRLNAALGNQDGAVFYTAPAATEAESLAALVEAMRRGEVEALFMLDTNPVYSAAGDLGFAEALRRVPLKIHAGLEVDETAEHADWHLPLAHPLEAWGDARSLDGTVTLLQPTIAPLYGGRSVPEILALLADSRPVGGLDLLQRHWQADQPSAEFAPKWRQALIDGFFADTAFAPEPVQPAAASASPSAGAGQGDSAADRIDVLFRPDPSVWDGAPGNNPWLQELPKPLTKLVWENAIAVSPALAERLRLTDGDGVAIEASGRRVEGPAWVLPGQADRVATVFLGYGRAAQGLLATGLGYDGYALRDHASPWRLSGATLLKTGRSSDLATTQDHSTMEGHDFVRARPIDAPPPTPQAEQPTLYPPWKDDGRAWGMVIDLDACIGCNACVVACQAENNIAVVGKEQVALGREMHWLRIDRYYAGGLDDPATHFQPVPCMHCEQAPCEVGCPVEATLHDHEGLNLMVYNRCVGTRACSGYCPYKVRHFNYLDYAAEAAPSAQAQRNPQVTVRARGVMEKCTYCVQRIVAARIASDREDKPIPDGAVQTACQGACPTRAITFGDLNDHASAVRAARGDPRNYALLDELNLRPRTTYLAELAPAAAAAPKAG